MKSFNTTAVCLPSKHYMVDLSERVKEIKKLVDDGKYFTINKARQYGKTTTLMSLQKYLESEYTVANISFESMGKSGFKDEPSFVRAFCKKIKLEVRSGLVLPENTKKLINKLSKRDAFFELDDLSDIFLEWCEESDRKIVLIIDEVDTATNNQIFLDFLGALRDSYINRDTKKIPTFQSVILAGVTDVKHLKAKIREDEDAKENSPWNIAADFNIDMSLSEKGIKGMLDDYEKDHNTGMDTSNIAKLLREYTNGYPFLVSRLCQLMDEQVSKKMSKDKVWTLQGFDEAVKLLLAEDNTLFQSLTKNLNNYPDLKAAIRSILMDGTRLTWNVQQQSIAQLQMYGLIRNDHNTVRVANRIFEILLYNLFLSDEEIKSNVFSKAGYFCKNQFVEDGTLNVRLVLEKFIETYTEVFGKLEDKFKEKDGREHFLLYLKPIINGTGNYYIEAQTRDMTRTDIIIDYLGKQYIIELKIWHGDRYNKRGEEQLREYLEYYNLNVGYMLSFNFNKDKETGVKQVHVEDNL